MSDYVEVFQGDDDQWRWHRRATNNEIASTSGEGFIDKAYAEESARRYNADVTDFRDAE